MNTKGDIRTIDSNKSSRLESLLYSIRAAAGSYSRREGSNMDRKVLLGKRIREIRKIRKLSQEALAERAGISAQYVSNIERGKENPTLDMLFTLADALKVTLAEMCDYETVQTMDRQRLHSLLRDLLKTADPERLRTAVKILKVVLR